MKKSLKITLSILLPLTVIGIFTSTCVCTYTYHWNLHAFWWSWFGVVWLVDIFAGGYIFYKQNRTDETKTFWLLVMILLPIIGAIIALIYNFKLKTYYGQPNNDHSKLQAAIFQAKNSIKIYSNSFFVTADTFNALNYACWKGVRVQLIIQQQKSRQKQDFLVNHLQKYLEDKIEFYITNKDIDESFIMIDEKELLITPTNFNFKNIYTEENISNLSETSEYVNTWNYDLERSSPQSLVKTKVFFIKKVWYKLINIFYPFF